VVSRVAACRRATWVSSGEQGCCLQKEATLQAHSAAATHFGRQKPYLATSSELPREPYVLKTCMEAGTAQLS